MTHCMQYPLTLGRRQPPQPELAVKSSSLPVFIPLFTWSNMLKESLSGVFRHSILGSVDVSCSMIVITDCEDWW